MNKNLLIGLMVSLVAVNQICQAGRHKKQEQLQQPTTTTTTATPTEPSFYSMYKKDLKEQGAKLLAGATLFGGAVAATYLIKKYVYNPEQPQQPLAPQYLQQSPMFCPQPQVIVIRPDYSSDDEDEGMRQFIKYKKHKHHHEDSKQ